MSFCFSGFCLFHESILLHIFGTLLLKNVPKKAPAYQKISECFLAVDYSVLVKRHKFKTVFFCVLLGGGAFVAFYNKIFIVYI